MMLSRRFSYAVLFSTLLGAGIAQAEPVRVVASFSILGDMVKQVGGDKIILDTIVGRDADAHTFEPTPSDAKALAQAQLLVLNGLQFEAWLPRLLKASSYAGPQVVATEGIVPLSFAHHHNHDHDHDHDHDRDHSHGHGAASDQAAPVAHSHAHGDLDPHAWQSLENATVYIRNIAQGLTDIDPANADYYQVRAQDYTQQLLSLDASLQAQFGSLPKERRKVITSHHAFAYLGKQYQIEFLPLLGISNMAEPSAREMAALIQRARAEHIVAIFTENVISPKLAEQIARESGAKMGGSLYSDALGPEGGEAGTYLDMMSFNGQRLYQAMLP